MTMLQIGEGDWINPFYLAQVKLIPAVVPHDERCLELYSHDGSRTVVTGLWVGSVMSSLGLLAKPYGHITAPEIRYAVISKGR